MIDLQVNISEKDKSYPIHIFQDNIENLKAKILMNLDGRKFLVVISEKVEKLYGKALRFNNAEKFVLKDGEKEKNINNYKKILDKAFKMKLTRKDAIIAIGGGVVGDITGFVASTYMRGIDYIQVPTTLLACVDSSVGGKVAVNNKFGKNLIGSFYQPSAVYINLNFLQTLDERQYKSGLGEVVKYIFIEKSCNCRHEFNLSNFISENIDRILSRNLSTLEQLIAACVILKISVVEQDEKESGLRKILNFGHTYGHAIENITKYKKYTHGEAVVKGMRFAFNLAKEKGFVDEHYAYIANDILDKFEFQSIPAFPQEKIIEAMKMDKKAENGRITFVLPTDYAQVREVSLAEDEIFVDKTIGL